MAMRGQYYMSNSLNSIAYCAIRSVALGLLIALHRSLSIRIIIVCARK